MPLHDLSGYNPADTAYLTWAAIPAPSALSFPDALSCLDDLYRIRCLCPDARRKIFPPAVILNRLANAFLVFCMINSLAPSHLFGQHNAKHCDVNQNYPVTLTRLPAKPEVAIWHAFC
jgi:hypothetical protein